MDQHRLKCFVAVFEKGSVSLAAQSLHMTQPPLSILIRKLEDELGVALFTRESNRLIPTSTGEIFYQRAKEMLATMQSVRRELRESQQGVLGTVRVGCSTAASLFIVPQVMSYLASETRTMTVHVQEGETNYLVQRLRDRHLDMAICRSRFVAADVQTRSLRSEPLLVALPPDHPLASEAGVTLAQLRNERFLLHSSPLGRGISDSLIEGCQQAGFMPEVVYWGVETLPMLLMVRQGLGVAFAPSSFAHVGLTNLPPLVPLVHPRIETHLSLMTLKQGHVSRVAQRFMDLVLNVASDSTD